VVRCGARPRLIEATVNDDFSNTTLLRGSTGFRAALRADSIGILGTGVLALVWLLGGLTLAENSLHDDRTVKILTAVNVAGELDRIAMRGARYGFPGWVSFEETKRGTKRHYIEQRSDAQAKAIEYLEGANTAGELVGRTLALLVMAVYAQEGAVAQSARAFHTVSVQSELPWAGEVPELIDELAAEKLPAALMDPILIERRTHQEQRRAALAAKAEAEARVDELQACIEDLAIG
jgi:hypothetical protein